jgi:hypothetical protein
VKVGHAAADAASAVVDDDLTGDEVGLRTTWAWTTSTLSVTTPVAPSLRSSRPGLPTRWRRQLSPAVTRAGMFGDENRFGLVN